MTLSSNILANWTNFQNDFEINDFEYEELMMFPPNGNFIIKLNELSDIRVGRHGSDWERPFFVIRYRQSLLCGYLDYDADHIVLIPHERTSARRISFLRHQIELIGKCIAIASPLPSSR